MLVKHRITNMDTMGKIEKVPSIQREKSGKDTAYLGQLEHKQFPKGGRNQVSRRVNVPCWHATPVVNAPRKLHVLLTTITTIK